MTANDQAVSLRCLFNTRHTSSPLKWLRFMANQNAVYVTDKPILDRGLEFPDMLSEGLAHVGDNDLHQF